MIRLHPVVTVALTDTAQLDNITSKCSLAAQPQNKLRLDESQGVPDGACSDCYHMTVSVASGGARLEATRRQVRTAHGPDLISCHSSNTRQ